MYKGTIVNNEPNGNWKEHTKFLEGNFIFINSYDFRIILIVQHSESRQNPEAVW